MSPPGEHSGATPISGVPAVGSGIPITVPVEKSGGFFRWPSPKALAFWVGLLVSVAIVGSVVGGAFFVEKKIYDTDKAAQQAVNAKVDTAQATVTANITALQKQVETSIEDAKDQRKEQRADMKDLKESVGTLLRRSR